MPREKGKKNTPREVVKMIIEEHEEGETVREIATKYDIPYKTVKNMITRENHKREQIKSGIALRAKGRPPKDYEITEDMKINELKYIIARKDSKIKRLEMENELMRDFLLLTERK